MTLATLNFGAGPIFPNAERAQEHFQHCREGKAE
jgi:hypothetical protein